MNKNLFVLHTQYNIILGVSYKNQYCLGDENDLVVYAEFVITDSWKQKLGKIFNHVYYVRENFEPLKRGLDFEKELKNQIKNFEFIHNDLRYDRMIISQDRPFENVLFHKIKKVNPDIQCIAVEEDAYFTAVQTKSNLKKGIGYTIKTSVKQLIRTVNFGCRYIDNGISCYGGSQFVSEIYVNFPERVRSELSNKEKLTVSKESMRKGIEIIYGSKLGNYSDEISVIIASDLIERYRYPEIIIQLYSSIIECCIDNNINIYFKYHPREKEKLHSNSNRIKELPAQTAIESILINFNPTKTCIVGNTSMSILTAKKLGFFTVSVVKLANPMQDIEKFFKQIGIYVPDSQDEILNIIRTFGEVDE